MQSFAVFHTDVTKIKHFISPFRSLNQEDWISVCHMRERKESINGWLEWWFGWGKKSQKCYPELQGSSSIMSSMEEDPWGLHMWNKNMVWESFAASGILDLCRFSAQWINDLKMLIRMQTIKSFGGALICLVVRWTTAGHWWSSYWRTCGFLWSI